MNPRDVEMVNSPEQAPNEATYPELTYEKGDVVALDGKRMTPAEVLTSLNKVQGENGIGRTDIVENRCGMKSRALTKLLEDQDSLKHTEYRVHHT